MKKHITIPAILFLFAGMLSCEKIVDFQQTAYKPKLVVYGALFQDSVPEIMVGLTQSYYGWEEGIEQQAYVEGATVSLSEGQNKQDMPLGGYKSDFFNVWEGLPTGYGQHVDFYRISSPKDSTYRVYAGSEALKGGTWYEFNAGLDDKHATRSIYVPQRPTGTETRLEIVDTSYTILNMYSDGPSTDVHEKRFELTVAYDISDNENVWHKPVVTYEVPLWGYYLIDQFSEYGGYLYVEDSILGKFSTYNNFQRAQGPGRYISKVVLGKISENTNSYPDGYTYTDTIYNFPFQYEQIQRLIKGDTLEKEYRVAGLVSHAQDQTMAFLTSLSIQRYSSSDPFDFSEPVILNANDEEGLGLLGGFAESEATVVKVKFYR